MRYSKYLVLLMTVLQHWCDIEGAPVDTREGKNLGYFDYVQQPEEFNNNFELEDNNDYISMALDEDNALSRTVPARKRPRPQISSPLGNGNPGGFNSPIYYIRLPPQPYMFVPGLGYISQPPPSPMSEFVNLPVSFVANGKPSTIYQWAGGYGDLPTEAPPILPPKPQKPQIIRPIESTVHRLPGQYNFNGKPDDIFVLRDSYNSLYGDALQNFYP